MQAYAQLVAAGKVRVIGASNMTPARLKASLETSRKLGLPRYESLQPLYNLSDRKEFETQFEPICRQEKLGVINYYSLAAGFLTGKYRSPEEGARHPGRAGRLKRYLDGRGMSILRALDNGTPRGGSGPDRSCMADRQTRHHRADCERHQPQAARRDPESTGNRAFKRGYRRARCGWRMNCQFRQQPACSQARPFPFQAAISDWRESAASRRTLPR
jgi:Aldo/keto reductase family